VTLNSTLYFGRVTHRRLRPQPYFLRHSAFWLLIDLDEFETLKQRLWLFSRDRFNVTSFYESDHGEQTQESLRCQVYRRLRAENIDFDGGVARLLCMPRIFGYAFNPLSIYFCQRSNGTLAAIIYEVRNTFGGRHSYVIPVEFNDGAVVRQHCNKSFYVSPFLDMDLRYEFRVVAPREKIGIEIIARDASGPLLVASMTGRRFALTDASILLMLIRVPFMTFKVISAIHWHALRMWFKGFALKSQPAPSKQARTSQQNVD
jgi:uncharacterized protein